MILTYKTGINTQFIMVCYLLQYHYQFNVLTNEDISINYFLLFSAFSDQINKYFNTVCFSIPLWYTIALFFQNLLWLCLINYKDKKSLADTIMVQELIKADDQIIAFQEDQQSMKEMTFRHSHFELKDRLQLTMPWLMSEKYLLIDENQEIIVDNLKLDHYLLETSPGKVQFGECLLVWFLECQTSTYSSNIITALMMDKSSDKSSDAVKRSLEYLERKQSHIEISGSNQGQNNTMRSQHTFKKIFESIFQTSNPPVQQLYTLYDIQSKHFDFSNQMINFIVVKNQQSYQIVMWMQVVLTQQITTQNNFKFHTKSLQHQSSRTNEQYSQQLLTNIFSSVSHEFGTYLNCIVALATTGCTDPMITEEIKDLYFEPMRINGYLLNFILSNIRDFNQILLNQFAIKLSDFNIKQEIQWLVKELSMSIKSRNNTIIININIDDSDQFNITNDVDRFRQILYQLLSNSIRFTQNGTITIEVSQTTYQRQDLIKVSVTDTGIGMTKIEQGRLSELFKNGQKLVKVSSNSVGCGLGLSISNMIGQYLSGHIKKGITFISSQQKGSMFNFHLVDSKQLAQNDNCDMLASITPFNSICYNEIQSSSQEVGSQRFYGAPIWRVQQIVPRGYSAMDLMVSRGFTVTENQISSVRGDNSSSVDREEQKILLKTQQVQEIKSYNDNFYDEDSILTPDLVIPIVNCKSTTFVLKYDWKGQCCSRVLIVDDEYFNILSLQMILRKYNTKMEFAFNGKQALEIVQKKNENPCEKCGNKAFTIYFLDINMPIMDGIETVQRLKTSMSLGVIQRGICIANTGFVDLETKLKCYTEGMDFYISKPIIIKELDDYLKKVFR